MLEKKGCSSKEWNLGSCLSTTWQKHCWVKVGLQDQIQVRWFFYIEVQTACSKRLLSLVRKLAWLLKAMKKSMVHIMPRRHVQSSCSKWYHSHPLTFSTGPTLIPVRRQERFPSRRSQRRGRGQPPGYEDSIHPDYLCKLSKALYGLNSNRLW